MAETPRKVVLAVDASSVSKDAVEWATKQLLRPGDQVHFLSVLEPLARSDYAGSSEGSVAIGEGSQCQPDPLALERTQKAIKSYTELVEARGFKDVSATTIVSCIGGTVDIGRQIVDYTNDKDSDILLMGSRGLGSLKRAVLGFIGLGSVSSYVVKHADCNVLVHKVPNLE